MSDRPRHRRDDGSRAPTPSPSTDANEDLELKVARALLRAAIAKANEETQRSYARIVQRWTLAVSPILAGPLTYWLAHASTGDVTRSLVVAACSTAGGMAAGHKLSTWLAHDRAHSAGVETTLELGS